MSSLGITALLLALQAGGKGVSSQAQQQQQTGPEPAAEAVAADTGTMRHANKRTPPLAYASRVARSTGSIHIDGKLDEGVWAQARPATQFYQTAPHEGEPATERTDVRVAFDDDAIYIGARLFDSDPAGVRGQLARRDASTEADQFEVAIDSYHDHNTSFVFGINPSGVKTDRVVGNDGFSSDAGWDPVWAVATRTDSAGWTVEMRIPLSSVSPPPRRRCGASTSSDASNARQSKSSTRTRVRAIGDTRRSSRTSTASNVSRNRGGSKSPRTRPRVRSASTPAPRTTRSTMARVRSPVADSTRNTGSRRASRSTRRPFFVEGSDIFNFNSNAQLFYSRRIGRAPQASADPRNGFVNEPDHATILGAGKLSGRAGAWRLGVLEATTAHEFAEVDSSGRRFKDEVEPLTNYFVGRHSAIGAAAPTTSASLRPR
jgi:hypothetical protein